MHRSVAARYTMALTVPTITTVPSSFSIQMEPLARLVPLSVASSVMTTLGVTMSSGQTMLVNLMSRTPPSNQPLTEAAVHEVADVGHGHAATHDDLLEAELFGGAPIGVVVGVAVEECAAHLEADPVRVALDQVAVGYIEPPGTALGLGVAQRDLAGGLGEQVALVVIADGHGVAVGRP